MERQAQGLLLVEDNPDHEELALLSLRQCRPRDPIAVVRDGAEALDYLFAGNGFAGRDVRDVPRVILLDLKLPKIDGLEVLREIRANEATRAVPVVVLTSSGEERDVAESYRLGANSYVRKPIEFESLAHCLRQVQSYWMAINQSGPLQWN